MIRYITIALTALLFFSACSYTIKIRDGKTAFEQKQYETAIGFLPKEFKKADRRSEKGRIAFMLAESFRKTDQSEKSLQWYKKAYDNSYGVDALKEYSYGLKRAERYEEAIENFEQLGLEIGSPYEYRKEITACKIAIEWKKEKNPEYRISETEFNSSGSDYAPVYYENNQLVLTSDRTSASCEDDYKWTGRKFMDIFAVSENGGVPKAFSEVINSEENEGTITFNKDFNECYFTRCGGDIGNVAYCKIFFSKKEGTEWSAPQLLDFQEETYNYMHPALSEGGGQLYFASDHPDGWGGYDIYVAERTATGWDLPRLMSRSINTQGNEVFPNLDKDTLYFSSDFLSGMGGLDIFQTYPMNSKTWAPPLNLMPPINTGADDFGMIIDPKFAANDKVKQIGYFVSSRPGSTADDIYKFEKIIPPPAPEPPKEIEKEIEYKMILEVFILEKIYQNPGDPNSKVLGRRPMNDAKLEMIAGDKKEAFTTGSDGLVTIDLTENTSYDFFGSKSGFLTGKENFSTVGIGKDPKRPIQKFELEIELDKIFANKEINLENIYYDFDDFRIRDDAKPTLNKLADALRLNPDIRIQLASHTDCRGNAPYNQNLSQKRAQSAVDYLIEIGIRSERLFAKGFGESSPAVECVCGRCSESEHQSNRRTTFAVLE